MLPIHYSEVPQVMDSIFHSTPFLNTLNDNGTTGNSEEDSVLISKLLSMPVHVAHSKVPPPVFRCRRASPSFYHKQEDTDCTDEACDSDESDRLLFELIQES